MLHVLADVNLLPKLDSMWQPSGAIRRIFGSTIYQNIMWSLPRLLPFHGMIESWVSSCMEIRGSSIFWTTLCSSSTAYDYSVSKRMAAVGRVRSKEPEGKKHDRITVSERQRSFWSKQFLNLQQPRSIEFHSPIMYVCMYNTRVKHG